MKNQAVNYAAIDIGSNAVRLLISALHHSGKRYYFKRVALIRLPLRLGHDAFTTGMISARKKTELMQTMQAYALLMKLHKVKACMACATAALREARNGPGLVQQIKRRTGIPLKIVTGQQEAKILYETHIAETLDPKKSYLYIDIGGGSTELTLFTKGKARASRSFDIGTVRILEGCDSAATWTAMKDWVDALRKKYKMALTAIGTGGNINKLYRLSEVKNGKLLPIKKLRELTDRLEMYSVQERIDHLGLHPDRADVIVPAAKIMLSILHWSKIKYVAAPTVGLVDGMLSLLVHKTRL